MYFLVNLATVKNKNSDLEQQIKPEIKHHPKIKREIDLTGDPVEIIDLSEESTVRRFKKVKMSDGNVAIDLTDDTA